MKSKSLIRAIILVSLFISGCMTTGYHYAKDPQMNQYWHVTVLDIKPQNIYNSVGVALVGPLAPVEAKGLRVTFQADGEKNKVSIVQPASNKYTLSIGQRAYYVISGGHVWVQPTSQPLPAGSTPANGSNDSLDKSKRHTVDAKAGSDKPINKKPAADSNVISRLYELKRLLDDKLISQKDYDLKKKELLESM